MASSPPPLGGGLFGWFAGNPVAANLLMLIMLLGGFVAASSINVETFPEIDPRQISITVPYPGAAPSEVEQAITKRMEEAVLGIEGVKRVRSSAAEGAGSVTIELKDFANAQKVKDDVDTAIDRLADFPPAEAEQVSVTLAEPSSVMMRLAVFGPVSELDLRSAAEQIEADLLLLDEVTEVALSGVRSREISIEVSEETLRQYALSLDQVADAVNRDSVNLSGGTLRTQAGEILLRTDAERRTGDAFRDIAVSTDESGRTVRLGDIANITDGFEDGDLINTFRGERAVFIEVSAGDDQDAFDVSGAVRGLLSGYAAPVSVSVEIVTDNTLIINERLNLLVRNALLGLALVFVFLSVTLDLRLAFWTSVGILVSFLGAFLIVGQFTTINMITLFGLIVVLGLVVDDAIVVGENIYDEQNTDSNGARAAVNGMLGVVAPVTIGILTSIAAFAPLLFSTGTLGQILFPVPIVVISVLIMSAIEAFCILPSHLSHGGHWSVGAMDRVRRAGQDFLSFARDGLILPLVELAMRARYLTIAASVAALILVFGLVGSGLIRFVFFPIIEGDEVTATLEMPDGTPFSQTREIVERIASKAVEAAGGPGSPNIDSLSVTIGAPPSGGIQGPLGSASSGLGSHLGGVRMKLTSPSTRKIGSAEIERRWREAVGEIAGVRTLSFESTLVGGGADLALELSHAEDAELTAAVEQLAADLRAVNGVSELETGVQDGKRQIEFILTPAGEAAGLRSIDIARQVRAAFFGNEVQRFQRGRNEIRVYVRYPEAERRSLADLDRFRIRLPNGEEAPLNVVARRIETISPTTIERVDGRRIISIEADVDESIATPNEVLSVLNNRILPELMERFPRLIYTFEGQSRDQQQDAQALGTNLLFALAVIFVLLASILRSYVQPLVIMAAIPFGAMSAILGHFLLGYDLSFLSMFGIVALSGVVINASIVLIDYYNSLRADEATSAHDAAVMAVKRRFRPIMLTTLTTFLGLLPMLTETSLQAKFLIPMAISLGFGILITGFLILALVPSLLMIIEDIGRLPTWFMERRKRT